MIEGRHLECVKTSQGNIWKVIWDSNPSLLGLKHLLERKVHQENQQLTVVVQGGGSPVWHTGGYLGLRI